MDNKLDELRRLYKLKLKKMIESVGTPEHAEYSRIEHELNRQQVILMKSSNPCPIPYKTATHCKECTGYYIKDLSVRKGNVSECSPAADGAFYCALKGEDNEVV